MTAPRLAATFLAGAFAFPAVAAAATAAPPWSEPTTVSAQPADDVGAPSLAFARSGAGLLGWSSADGFGVGPTTPGPAGHLAGWPAGAVPGAVRRLSDDLAVAPVLLSGGRVLLVRERTLRRDENFNAGVRLGVSIGTLNGRAGALQSLARYTSARATAAAVSTTGRMAVAWVERRPKPRSRDFEAIHVLRLASAGRDGRFGRPRTVADMGPVFHPGVVRIGLAFGDDGRLVVAYPRLRERSGRLRPKLLVEALSGPAAGPLRRQALGPHRGVTFVRTATAPTGRTVVAWGTQDGGEEADEPFTVRAAVREPGRARFGEAQTLDPGEAKARPAGDLAVAIGGDGTATLTWSGVRGQRASVSHPVLTATASPGARFAAVHELDPNGAAGDVAIDTSGRALVTWSRIMRGNEQQPDQIFAALRPAGSMAFAASEAVSPPEIATQPAAAFDPRTGRPAIAWSGRPGGIPPENGRSRSAVVRVAVRDR